jgi:ribosome-associated toxin RatA of RatAB toxin-antitoxin module
MINIHSKNTRTLPFSALEIWDTIIDFEKYPEWWPSTVTIKVLRIQKEVKGSQIKASPYGGLGFVCEVVEVRQPTMFVMDYSGVYKGRGVWTIAENNGRCDVVYEINLEINNFFIRALSYLLPVERIHSQLMDDVLSGLEKSLEQKRKWNQLEASRGRGNQTD